MMEEVASGGVLSEFWDNFWWVVVLAVLVFPVISFLRHQNSKDAEE